MERYPYSEQKGFAAFSKGGFGRVGRRKGYSGADDSRGESITIFIVCLGRRLHSEGCVTDLDRRCCEVGFNVK